MVNRKVLPDYKRKICWYSILASSSETRTRLPARLQHAVVHRESRSTKQRWLVRLPRRGRGGEAEGERQVGKGDDVKQVAVIRIR